MQKEKQTRKSQPKKKTGDLFAGVGVIAIILLILWVIWTFGNVIFAKVIPDNPMDRLGAYIIGAAVLHAHFTTTKKEK